MRRFHKRPQRKFYEINQYIRAPSLRVVDAESKLIGIISKDEALRKAQGLEQDLVLISPRANPPVAKIIDFKKFLYQEEKKQKEARKGGRKGVVKDIKFGLFIADADLERLVHKTQEFLEEGHQVRLNLTLKGREMGKQSLGLELVNKYISKLGELNIAKEPRLEGRVIRAVVSRKK